MFILASDDGDGSEAGYRSEDGVGGEGEEEEEEEEKEEEKEGDKDKEEEEEEEDIDLEGLRPTSKHCKLASKQALKVSGLYPELDFLTMLWPQTLCDLIVEETNRYACRKRRRNWIDVTRSELYTFFGVNLAMGIHKLPDIWSRDGLLRIPEVQKHMISQKNPLKRDLK